MFVQLVDYEQDTLGAPYCRIRVPLCVCDGDPPFPSVAHGTQSARQPPFPVGRSGPCRDPATIDPVELCVTMRFLSSKVHLYCSFVLTPVRTSSQPGLRFFNSRVVSRTGQAEVSSLIVKPRYVAHQELPIVTLFEHRLVGEAPRHVVLFPGLETDGAVLCSQLRESSADGSTNLGSPGRIGHEAARFVQYNLLLNFSRTTFTRASSGMHTRRQTPVTLIHKP